MFGQSQYIIYIIYIYIAERLPLQYKDNLILGKEKTPRLKGWESSEATCMAKREKY